MSEQIKTIKKIILHKDDGLTQALLEVSKVKDEKNFVRYEILKEILLKVDKNAVDLTPYNEGIITDIRRGHWDIYRRSDEKENDEKESSVVFVTDKELTARSPLLDVKNGTVAIDFGTKSTVAGFINEKSTKQLIRIGRGNRGLEEQSDYENPTTIEFVNIDDFMKMYQFCKTRPYTSFNDICVSHTAQNNLKSDQNNEFYRFFTNLKQWAGSSGNKFRIRDKHKVITLKDFADCGENDLNPIELYAYYIGRYINNMTSGIYLEYLISYPVKYSLEVRQKLQESFERGIKKSIPFAVLCNNECASRFKVEMTASEPAAYAISALKEYGFYSKEYLDKTIHYGVFDFGGGTTDFDFGIWKKSDKKRYEFVIEHFGEGGDQYLGGENLLGLLAYEVVKMNKNYLIQEGFSFIKPENREAFGGSESLLQDSQEARQNTDDLKEYLRVVWEYADLFVEENRREDIDEELLKVIQRLEQGTIEIQLINNNKELKSRELLVNVEKLLEVLRKEVAEGVEQFYHSFKKVAPKMEGLKELHIFLGGNSSRSILVKEAFGMLIEQAKEENDPTEFILYPPLGTKEAEEKQAALGINAKEEELSRKVTCKTGVVFGLLDSRKTGKIQVISEVSSDEEAKFKYYLGEESFGNFSIVLDKDNVNISDNWEQFLPYADITEFELYYTKDARATTNKLLISEATKITLKLDKEYGENDCICISFVGPDTIKYAVFDNERCIKEFEAVKLKD